MQEHLFIFSICSAHSSPELVKSIPNAPRKYARAFLLDFRRYVLRTVAKNLSKVSQIHPENVQEHFLIFSTLCSAHSSPELVKRIPNAPRKYARAFFLDVRRYVLRTVAQNLSKVSQMHPEKCKSIF